MKFKKYIIPTIMLLCLTFYCYADNEISNLILKHDKNDITVTPQLQFSTSSEIKEAIDNGIRVQLIVKSSLYEPRTWWFDKTISNEYIQLEVSYYVLGKYYVILNKNTEQRIGNNNYYKLWSNLNRIINIKLQKNDSKNLWVKLRLMLDKGSLPTAMQLPVLFNENWDIDTEWYSQKVPSD